MKGASRLHGKHLGRIAALALNLAITVAVAHDAGSSRKYISEGREAFVNRTTPACKAAFRYVELLTEEKFSELRSLFADQVDYIGPDGKPLSRGDDGRRALCSGGAANERPDEGNNRQPRSGRRQ